MIQELWIIRYEKGWMPKGWNDSPPTGQLFLLERSTEEHDISVLKENARGFNELEIKNPVGCWAIVVEKTPLIVPGLLLQLLQ